MTNRARPLAQKSLQRTFLAALAAVPLQSPPATLRAPPRLQERDAVAQAVDGIGRAAIGPDLSALVVAIDVRGERFLSRGFAATHAEAVPDGDTPFHAGPLLSTFLSVAALRLAHAERLDLDASLAEHLPELPHGGLGVRVDHLLTHTSGIPGYGELLRAFRRSSPAGERERILAWLRNGPLDSVPGTCASYANTNDLLLGLVLERVAQTSVQAHLAATLFAPAKMEDTAFAGERGAARDAAVEQEFAGSFEDVLALPPFGAERLLSTAHDLLRFQRALVELRLLPAAALELRATPARLTDGSRADCGRGISLTGLGEHACHSAGGALGGERVQLAYYPSLDTTIVVWASGDDPPVQQLSARVARALFDLQAPEVSDLATTPEQRARYVGDYFEGCTSHAIVDEEQHLVLYPPDGPRRVLFHQGGESFVAGDDPDVRLEFESRAGKVVAFLLSEHGVTIRARRLF